MLMTIKGNNKNRKGFTLVELMFAITILAIGLLAVAGMQGMATNENLYANRYSIATSLAQEVLEEMLSREINAPAAGFPASPDYALFTNAPFTAATYATRSVQGVGVFTANYVVTPNTPAANISEVMVSITYTNRPTPYIVYGYKRIPVL